MAHISVPDKYTLHKCFSSLICYLQIKQILVYIHSCAFTCLAVILQCCFSYRCYYMLSTYMQRTAKLLLLKALLFSTIIAHMCIALLQITHVLYKFPYKQHVYRYTCICMCMYTGIDISSCICIAVHVYRYNRHEQLCMCICVYA